MAYDASDVVLVPFPYRDRLAERTRPAIVISCRDYNQRDDLVVAAVTSQPARFDTDCVLVDWQATCLQLPSTARMLLTTIATSRVVHRIGRLTDRDWIAVQARVQKVFAWP